MTQTAIELYEGREETIAYRDRISAKLDTHPDAEPEVIAEWLAEIAELDAVIPHLT